MTGEWLNLPDGIAAERAAAFAALVPVIVTDRLTLRAPRLTDWPVLESIWTTDRGEYIGGPMSDEDALLDFKQCVAGWFLRGLGYWTITLTADGSVLGLAGFGQEFGDPETELGWMLTAAAEGQGYALEAAGAILPTGLDYFGPGGFVSYVHQDNHRSRRLATRLGARADRAPHPLYAEGLVYRHGARE